MSSMVIERHGRVDGTSEGLKVLHADQEWVAARAKELATAGWRVEEDASVTDLGKGEYVVRVVMNSEKRLTA